MKIFFDFDTNKYRIGRLCESQEEVSSINPTWEVQQISYDYYRLVEVLYAGSPASVTKWLKNIHMMQDILSTLPQQVSISLNWVVVVFLRISISLLLH